MHNPKMWDDIQRVVNSDGSDNTCKLVRCYANWNRIIEMMGFEASGIKYKTYVDLNPKLVKSSVYNTSSTLEHNRIVYTRLRLSSHHLQVETGKWSRVPRTLETTL